jgi:predicted membrane-bound dolichyl-phosphate-mannose-protein mannosyltransferase
LTYFYCTGNTSELQHSTTIVNKAGDLSKVVPTSKEYKHENLASQELFDVLEETFLIQEEILDLANISSYQFTNENYISNLSNLNNESQVVKDDINPNANNIPDQPEDDIIIVNKLPKKDSNEPANIAT